MLYLEDYLELIEHLPQELLDRFTDIRERDLQVHNSSEQLKEKVKQFFADAKKLKPEQRQCEYERLLKEYGDTAKYADEKVQISTHMYDIMIKLVQRLESELEKFKLELEADHAGITEELERRSLELDVADTSIHSHLNNSNDDNNTSVVFKDRRRSEHRHHPYHNHHNNDNGYNQNHHGRAKLSNHEHNNNNNRQDHVNNRYHHNHHHHNNHHNNYHHNSNHGSKYRHHHTSSAASSRQQSAATSPAPMGYHGHMVNGISTNNNTSKPSSVAGDSHESDHHVGGHYEAALFNNNNNNNNNSGFTNPNQYNNNKNETINPHHSALSEALASPPTNNTTFAMMNNNTSSVHNKISTTGKHNLKSNDPLVTAATQAIAATQQLHQGRRTPSLKASFAAINAAGLAQQLDPSTAGSKLDGSQRNALAPMAPDQQAFSRYGHQFAHHKNPQHPQQQQQQQQQQTNGNPNNPLYISVTKSGRPTKRPKHHASHLYPDESPTSISSDNSVFENNESLSSADFIETGTNFGSNSPSSIDFASSRNNTAFYHGDDTKYCICRQISYGEMVACDNNECEIEWFHYDCVGVSQPPKGKWYCPDCLKKMAKNHHHQQQQDQQQQAQHIHIQQKKRGRKEKDHHYLKDD